MSCSDTLWCHALLNVEKCVTTLTVNCKDQRMWIFHLLIHGGCGCLVQLRVGGVASGDGWSECSCVVSAGAVGDWTSAWATVKYSRTCPHTVASICLPSRPNEAVGSRVQPSCPSARIPSPPAPTRPNGCRCVCVCARKCSFPAQLCPLFAKQMRTQPFQVLLKCDLDPTNPTALTCITNVTHYTDLNFRV